MALFIWCIGRARIFSALFGVDRSPEKIVSFPDGPEKERGLGLAGASGDEGGGRQIQRTRSLSGSRPGCGVSSLKRRSFTGTVVCLGLVRPTGLRTGQALRAAGPSRKNVWRLFREKAAGRFVRE